MFDLSPDSTALVIVDMQNDFVRVGAPLEVPDARATIPAQRRLLDAFRAAGHPVVFTKFVAGSKRTLMWNWSPVIAPPTCCCWRGFVRSYGDVRGELECTAVIDELAPLPEEPQLEKYGYNGFHRTSLTDVLRAHGVDTVVITGTVTQICVEDTARGAFHEGFQAVVVADAVSSFDPDLHDATLRNIEMKFGRVLTTDAVLTELAAVAVGGDVRRQVRSR
ncbi:MAG: cysteine hydrolase [Actinobacteria bacterium]|nr:cysteine hydrolase [Actinomycetota bacterium]